MINRVVKICNGSDVFSAYESIKRDFDVLGFNGIIFRIDGNYKKSNIKAAEKYVADNTSVFQKQEAFAVDMGIDHYEIVKVKIVPSQNVTPIYGYYVDSRMNGKRLNTFKTLDEAKKYATHYAKTYGEVLCIGKCIITGKENDEFCTDIDVTIRKTKPAIVPKNAAVREVHKYYFYGKAAE